jgi:hypothetical protein
VPSYGLTPLRRAAWYLTVVSPGHFRGWVSPAHLACLRLPMGVQYWSTTPWAFFWECLRFAQRERCCPSRLSHRCKACELTSVLKSLRHPTIFGLSIFMTASGVAAFILSMTVARP